MISVDDLISGPQGARLCWYLAYPSGSISAGRVRVPLERELSQAVARFASDSDGAIWSALRASFDSRSYWEDSLAVDGALSSSEMQAALRPFAELAISRAPSTWWSAPGEPDVQYVVNLVRSLDDSALEGHRVPDLHAASQPSSDGGSLASPTLVARKSAVGAVDFDDTLSWAIAEPTAGYLWATPTTPSIVTTPSVNSVGPTGLWLTYDAPTYQFAMAFPAVARPGVCVYEIDSARDWLDLVLISSEPLVRANDPSRGTDAKNAPNWVTPRWRALRDQIDGIRLTVNGFLSASGRPIKMPNEARTVLVGWAPGETYWLTNSLSIDEESRSYWVAENYRAWRRLPSP